MSNAQNFKSRKPAMSKAEPGTIKRIFSYIFQYKWRVVAIVVCILVGAAAQAGSALFLQSLIDTYILPMVGGVEPRLGAAATRHQSDGLPVCGWYRDILGLAVADYHR